jgi:carbamoyl-phosphate synthase large subunit
MSLANRDKEAGLAAAVRFVELGFSICATDGTARFLEDNGVPVESVVAKIGEGDGSDSGRPTAADLIAEGKIQLVVNTPRGRGPRADGAYIRRAANVHQVACLTTVAAARAAAAGIADWAAHPLEVRSLQEFHQEGQQRLPL